MKIIDAATIYYVLTKKASSYDVNAVPTYALTKVAFDTRRIDQETEYNPRRGLQYYHRSEGFIKKDCAAVVATFNKLKATVDQIKSKYIGAPEWLDSHCRVLSSALDRILRADQQDYEFFEPQLNYLEELMDVRYRLKLSDIEAYGEDKLKDMILAKDEPLLHTQIFHHGTEEGGRDIVSTGLDELLRSLLGSVKATTDHPEIERSFTITVRDKIVK